MRRIVLAFCLAAIAPLALAEDLAVLPPKLDDAAPTDMMYTYLRLLANEALDRRAAEYEKIKTLEQVTGYQKRMREFFIEQLGGFPERTPLNAKVVGRESRDGYRIEKVIFESQPRHYVTGVLFLPLSKPPYPAVLVPCGHSANGKASDLYQRASIFLAKSGIAAFCYDPIGQGERFQALDDKGKPRFGSTLEHTLVGVGSILLGRNAASYRVWDGMRAIDYLVSRKEIDPKRIGCTGNSGGGTLTCYLMALDDRILCAAPGCYVTSLRRLIETIGPQDAEQNIFAQIVGGMDHADYVLMRAPKPTLLCAATRDFFDIEGTWNTFRQAKRLYTRFALPEGVNLVEADESHGFSAPLRLGMVRWMRLWLMDRHDLIVEPDFEVMKDEQLQCSPRGQVMLIEGARSVFDINRDLEERLAQQRKQFWSTTPKAEAIQKVREIAGIAPLAALPSPDVVRTGTVKREGYEIEKITLRPCPGIWLPALLFIPAKSSGQAYLYLNGQGKQADAAPGGPIEQLVRAGHVVMAADLRGIGETKNTKGGKGWLPYFDTDWKDYFLAYMLGKSYVGMRAEDVLVCTRFVAGYRSEDKPRPVHLVAVGDVGPAALHAAAVEPQMFASLRLERSLVSWANVVRTPVSKNQLINAVHGALRTYDLPDLLATLPADQVTVVQPLNAAGDPIEGK